MKLSDIQEAFDGDEDIVRYFDPMYDNRCGMSVPEVVYFKLVEYMASYNCRFVKCEGGYFFFIWRLFRPNTLVSFALSRNARLDREKKKEFWSLIKKRCGRKFDCHLFTINHRAIGWLRKCGMNIVHQDELITKLVCQ